MSLFERRRSRAATLAFALIPCLLPVPDCHAQGGSAVITLVMPVGARQLGMGEAATALGDDVYGTYWNPGGLAFGPVSNEWELMLPKTYTREGLELQREFTSLVTRPRTGFLLKSLVWAGAKDGLLHYNGKRWRDFHEYVMEQGDKVEDVVRRYAGTGDGLDSLLARVKRFNRIQSQQDEDDLITLRLPYNLLFPGQAVTALALDNTDRLWVGTPVGLYRFDGQSWKSFDREEGFTYLPQAAAAAPAPAAPGAGEGDTAAATRDSVAAAADTAARDTAAASAASDTAQAAADSAVAAAPAAPPESQASPFRTLSVTALLVKGASVWIGTEDGLYEFKKGAIARRGENLLPTQRITCLGGHESVDEIYVGLEGRGIARYKAPRASGAAAKWKLFGAADGLLDSSAVRLLVDKYGHVYSAHAGGVSHFTLKEWERYRFPRQDVRGLALDEDNRVWIATSEGAWKFTPPHATAKGRSGKDKAPEAGGRKGDLVHFHTGNGLRDKSVGDVATQGGDVWFLTGAGVERYNNAKSQVGFFYESLLPVLNLDDLYHAFMAATFPIEEWGTLGGFVNYVSFGQNLSTSAEGDERSKFSAYELVAGLTYATRLTKNAGLGVNAKFIYSALSQGVPSTSGEKTDGIAASYALDLGFLQRNLAGVRGLSLGLVLQNMGPAVFYVDQAQSDPIPFTWKLGLAYDLVNTPNHRLVVAADANREAFAREGDRAAPVWIGAWREIVYPSGHEGGLSWQETWTENARRTVYNTGAEYVYANVVALRSGYLHDVSGQRYEMDIGLGFMLSDILQIDGCFIKSFDNGIRNGQRRFSMILRF